MRGTTNDKLRLSILAALSLTATAPGVALAQAAAAEAEPAPPAAGNEQTSLDTIVVTVTY